MNFQLFVDERHRAEIDQLRRNRSVSAIDSDYRAQLSAIVGELWQPERQRSATQTQANRPTSAAGAPAGAAAAAR